LSDGISLQVYTKRYIVSQLSFKRTHQEIR